MRERAAEVWAKEVRFVDSAGTERTEYLEVGDDELEVGGHVTVRYQLADPTVVQAEPVVFIPSEGPHPAPGRAPSGRHSA